MKKVIFLLLTGIIMAACNDENGPKPQEIQEGCEAAVKEYIYDYTSSSSRQEYKPISFQQYEIANISFDSLNNRVNGSAIATIKRYNKEINFYQSQLENCKNCKNCDIDSCENENRALILQTQEYLNITEKNYNERLLKLKEQYRSPIYKIQHVFLWIESSTIVSTNDCTFLLSSSYEVLSWWGESKLLPNED